MYNNYYPYNSGYGFSGHSLFNSGRNLKFNWSNILNGTQRTLSLINEAIPVIYQIKPVFNNARKIFRIMSAVKEDDTPLKSVNVNTSQNNNTQEKVRRENSPTFFL